MFGCACDCIRYYAYECMPMCMLIIMHHHTYQLRIERLFVIVSVFASHFTHLFIFRGNLFCLICILSFVRIENLRVSIFPFFSLFCKKYQGLLPTYTYVYVHFPLFNWLITFTFFLCHSLLYLVYVCMCVCVKQRSKDTNDEKEKNIQIEIYFN